MSWKLYSAFDVYGVPKGQPRVKAFFNKNIGKARVYTPGTAESWKGLVALMAGQAMPGAPRLLSGPIRLGLAFYFPRPARLLRKKDPDGLIYHTAKPDFDNLSKGVADVLTEVGVLSDDAIVCSWYGDKFYAARGQATGALIQIFTYTEDVA